VVKRGTKGPKSLVPNIKILLSYHHTHFLIIGTDIRTVNLETAGREAKAKARQEVRVLLPEAFISEPRALGARCHLRFELVDGLRGPCSEVPHRTPQPGRGLTLPLRKIKESLHRLPGVIQVTSGGLDTRRGIRIVRRRDLHVRSGEIVLSEVVEGRLRWRRHCGRRGPGRRGRRRGDHLVDGLLALHLDVHLVPHAAKLPVLVNLLATSLQLRVDPVVSTPARFRETVRAEHQPGGQQVRFCSAAESFG